MNERIGDSMGSMDPTAFGDEVASLMRQWYECNREGWFARHMPSADRRGTHADEFMLRLIIAVGDARAVVKARANGVRAVMPGLD